MAANKPVDVKLFISVWLQAQREDRNQKWVAEQIDRSAPAVYSIYHRLRKRGVKLTPLPTGKSESNSAYSVNELNRLIEEQSHAED
jgi:transposase